MSVLGRSIALGVMGIGIGLTLLPPVEAARIPTCMRVVPSGELVIRYGVASCRR